MVILILKLYGKNLWVTLNLQQLYGKLEGLHIRVKITLIH